MTQICRSDVNTEVLLDSLSSPLLNDSSDQDDDATSVAQSSMEGSSRSQDFCFDVDLSSCESDAFMTAESNHTDHEDRLNCHEQLRSLNSGIRQLINDNSSVAPKTSSSKSTTDSLATLASNGPPLTPLVVSIPLYRLKYHSACLNHRKGTATKNHKPKSNLRKFLNKQRLHAKRQGINGNDCYSGATSNAFLCQKQLNVHNEVDSSQDQTNKDHNNGKDSTDDTVSTNSIAPLKCYLPLNLLNTQQIAFSENDDLQSISSSCTCSSLSTSATTFSQVSNATKVNTRSKRHRERKKAPYDINSIKSTISFESVFSYYPPNLFLDVVTDELVPAQSLSLDDATSCPPDHPLHSWTIGQKVINHHSKKSQKTNNLKGK